MKTLISACAALAALVVAPNAYATPITFSAAGGDGAVIDNTTMDILGAGSVVSFNVQDLVNDPENGFFEFTGGFVNNAVNDAVGAATVIAFEPTNLGSIANLVITFTDGADYRQSFQITGANGEGINLTGFDVNFGLAIASAGPAISFIASGIAVPSIAGINPGFQVQITEAPLPGALILMICGLFGLGAASRSRR